MLRPETEQDLSEIVKATTGALQIRGGGTRPVGHPVAGDVLDVSKLAGITRYEPGALTLVARAGTPVAQIKDALAAEKQRLAFEPMDHRGVLGTTGEPTLGGIVATNASGPRRVQIGACRDFLLGVRFVDGQGEILKNGGRVMKNVTGYDLVKLMCGSYGTLGVVSEVSLKVLPEVETEATVQLHGLADGQAVQAMAAALGSPFEVSGAAHLPDGQTVLRVEGFEASVGYRAQKLRDVLAAFGEVLIEADPARSRTLWRAVRDVAPFHDRSGDIWRFSVRPTDAPDVVAALRKRHAVEVIYDWGGGLIWVLSPEGSDLRAIEFSGHATLWRAVPEVKEKLRCFHPEPAALRRISTGLRDRFDPRNILNPGLME